MHKITDVTLLGSSMVRSGNTGRQRPVVKSSGIETARRFRSMDFG